VNPCKSSYVTGFETTRLPHTQYQTYDFTRNELLAQYTIIFTAGLAPKPRVWFLWQTLCKPWVALWRHWMVMALLYWCLEDWTSHEGLANVCYLTLECCEHKKGSIGPQTGPLAFNCLRIPFCTPILSPPSSPQPPPLLLPPAISLPSRKSCLNFGCLKVIHPHNFS